MVSSIFIEYKCLFKQIFSTQGRILTDMTILGQSWTGSNVYQGILKFLEMESHHAGHFFL